MRCRIKRFTYRLTVVTSIIWVFIMVYIFSYEDNSLTVHLRKHPNVHIRKWNRAQTVPVNLGKPGELGQPVDLQKLQNETFHLNMLNLVVSDLISLNRSLKDQRSDACKAKVYPELLPSTTIVIVFYNEAWSTLFRTVWSAINRSPKELVDEIILVDDASTRDYLGKKLDDYIKTLPIPIRLIRCKERMGLTRAKIVGAKEVKSKIITFLDAHCECMEGWLEPLLARIALDRKIAVSPITELIDPITFEVIKADENTWIVFSRKFLFVWEELSTSEKIRRNYDPTEPIRTPIMVGGIFSIEKNYFFEMGAYDEGMHLWGGENMEMSIRLWTCGGILEIATCSHVGHIYRINPYIKSEEDRNVVTANNIRFFTVWMDEWAEFLFILNPAYRNIKIAPDIEDRKDLKKRLKCKGFKWYLENIYPESSWPLDYRYFGSIRNKKLLNYCLDSGSNPLVILYQCYSQTEFTSDNQLFLYSKTGEIKDGTNTCLDSVGANDTLAYLFPCHFSRGNQDWIYFVKNHTIYNRSSQACLDFIFVNNTPTLVPKKCDGSLKQQWAMDRPFQWQSPIHKEDFM